MNTRAGVIGILIVTGLRTVVFGQHYYQFQQSVISSGGRSTSAAYRTHNTMSEPLAGQSSSGDFRQGIGFWHQYNGFKTYLSGALAVADGWNLLSVPKTVRDYRKSLLYSHARSSAFAYEGSYRVQDTLRNGVGFWLKFAGNQLVSYAGTARTTDSIPVKAGWNIIGSIGSFVATGSILQSPPSIVKSPYFGYHGTYTLATTIEPGKGYWVRTSAAGVLVLTSSFAAPPSQPMAGEADLEQLNAITFETGRPNPQNRRSISQKLFFGTVRSAAFPLERYDLPPIPPSPTMDVRFASNRSVELLPEDFVATREIALRITTEGTPVKFGWSIVEQNGLKYTLIQKRAGKEISRHRLSGRGSMMLQTEDRSVGIRVERIPTKYALYQNYPNPFNPSTTIRFDLPRPSNVTLKVYDVLGREVSVVFDNQAFEEGGHEARVDLRTAASGAYFYRLDVRDDGSRRGTFSPIVRKMLLLR